MGNSLSCCNRANSPSLYHASRRKQDSVSNSGSVRRVSSSNYAGGSQNAHRQQRRRSTTSPTTSGFIDGALEYEAGISQQQQYALESVPVSFVGPDGVTVTTTQYRQKQQQLQQQANGNVYMGDFDYGNRQQQQLLLNNNSSNKQPYIFQYNINGQPMYDNGVLRRHPNNINNNNNHPQYFDTDEEGYVSENRTPILAAAAGGGGGGLHHISEREHGDGCGDDPSSHPTLGPIFKRRSRMCLDKLAWTSDKMRKRRSAYYLNSTAGTPSEASYSGRLLRKFNSCSTIYIDDSTISQPNLRSTLKCVALAIYFHILQREHVIPASLEIFDERRHPVTRDTVAPDHWERNPEHRHIYRFLRLLFHAAQLTAEVAIITLVYLERLLTYAELDIGPNWNWKRMLLGSVMLASKVWDDQAVWNVDYCQILRDVDVDDMNELERTYLEALQFNINIPASVYAKYYFHLRDLADEHPDLAPVKWDAAAEPLRLDRAVKLEAISRLKGLQTKLAATNNNNNNAATTAANGAVQPAAEAAKQPMQQHQQHSGGAVIEQMFVNGGQPLLPNDNNNNNVGAAGDAGNNNLSVQQPVQRRHRSNSVDNSAAQQNRRSIAVLS